MSGVRRFYPPTEGDIPMHGFRPYSDVHRERIRAHEKHDANGDSMERKRYDDESWLSVLVEEVGEVARELCELRHGNVTRVEHMRQLREELVQVAAMSTAWIDAIDLTLCDATHPTAILDDTHPAHEAGQPVACCKRVLHDGEHLSWSGRERW